MSACEPAASLASRNRPLQLIGWAPSCALLVSAVLAVLAFLAVRFKRGWPRNQAPVLPEVADKSPTGSFDPAAPATGAMDSFLKPGFKDSSPFPLTPLAPGELPYSYISSASSRCGLLGCLGLLEQAVACADPPPLPMCPTMCEQAVQSQQRPHASVHRILHRITPTLICGNTILSSACLCDQWHQQRRATIVVRYSHVAGAVEGLGNPGCSWARQLWVRVPCHVAGDPCGSQGPVQQR